MQYSQSENGFGDVARRFPGLGSGDRDCHLDSGMLPGLLEIRIEELKCTL